MKELLRPLEQTASLCGMRYLPPFLVQGTLGLTDEALAEHAREYVAVLEGLRDGAYDHEALRDAPRLRAAARVESEEG